MAEEGFLSRWSRRKRGEVPEESAPAPLVSPEPPSPVEPDPVLDVADLPPIESLTIESPITAFLRPGVPAALRNAALKRAWSLDPVIRDFVGPADYAWDFNAPDGIPGFSLELGGDVRKLLAQAIGRAEPGDEPPPGGPPEAEPTESEGPARREEDRFPSTLLAEAPPAETIPGESDAAPRKRHGSALPS